VFRDFPADDIVAGSKRSNLRQLVHEYMSEHGMACRCIRCREVRGMPVDGGSLRLAVSCYDTSSNAEQFLSYETREGMLAGFLRLSLPLREPVGVQSSAWDVLPEIAGAAMIRELHVYGPALGIGKASAGEAQHLGLGRRLLAEAGRCAKAAGYERLAVISAIGTRTYYERLGFTRGELYMRADLSDQPLAEEGMHE
jgi:elongator complex protein 3